MISLKQVQTEIAEILSKDRQLLKSGERNRLKARLTLLSVCKNYLESAPTEEFILCERRRIEKLMSAKSAQFEQWCASNKEKGFTLKEQKKEFEKEYNFKKFRGQLKALNFLLSNRNKTPVYEV